MPKREHSFGNLPSVVCKGALRSTSMCSRLAYGKLPAAPCWRSRLASTSFCIVCTVFMFEAVPAAQAKSSELVDSTCPAQGTS